MDRQCLTVGLIGSFYDHFSKLGLGDFPYRRDLTMERPVPRCGPVAEI